MEGLISLLHHPTILSRIGAHLTVPDLFQLSATCQEMRWRWSRSRRVIDVLQLHVRVGKILRLPANERVSPFVRVRNIAGRRKNLRDFRCLGGCGRTLPLNQRVYRKFCRSPMCEKCFTESKNYQSMFSVAVRCVPLMLERLGFGSPAAVLNRVLEYFRTLQPMYITDTAIPRFIVHRDELEGHLKRIEESMADENWGGISR